jgi:hypothetical protein
MSSNFLPRKQVVDISRTIIPVQNQMKVNSPPYIPVKRTSVAVPNNP